jgi:hypothetical protein
VVDLHEGRADAAMLRKYLHKSAWLTWTRGDSEPQFLGTVLAGARSVEDSDVVQANSDVKLVATACIHNLFPMG